MEIRNLYPGDRGAIKKLLEGTLQFTDEEKECAVELMDISLGAGPDGGDYEFLVAAHGGNDYLCGFLCFGSISFTRGCYDLYWIVSHPRLRNNGVGTRLLNRLEEILRERGARKLFAETSSEENYIPARNFYKKTGFVQVAQIPDFYKPGDDKLVYVKNLIAQNK